MSHFLCLLFVAAVHQLTPALGRGLSMADVPKASMNGLLHPTSSSLTIEMFMSADPKLNPFADVVLEDTETGWTVVNSNRSVFYRSRRAAKAKSMNANVTYIDDETAYKADIDAPWEQLLIGGPLAVNLLGQLLVISSRKDFAFESNVSNYQYEFMQHPDSFSASLIQIGNEGWRAFEGAHMNMNKIQLYMRQIPAHIKTSLKLTAKASPLLIARLLPKTLKNIERISKECTDLAVESHSKFHKVMGLIGEVVLMSGKTRGVHQRKLKDAQIELNVSLQAQILFRKREEFVKEQFEEMRLKVRQAENQYHEALNEIPTGWNAVFQTFVSNILSVATQVLKFKLMGPFAAAGGGGQQSNNGSSGSKQREHSGSSTSADTSEILSYTKIFADAVSKVIPLLEKVAAEKREGKGLKTSAIDDFKNYKKVFDLLLKSFDNIKPANGASEQAKNLVSEGSQLADQAVDVLEKSTTSKAKASKVEMSGKTPKKSVNDNKPVNNSKPVDEAEHASDESGEPDMSEFTLEELKQKFQSLSQRAQPSAAAASLLSGAETAQSGVGSDHTPTGNAKFKAMIAKERLLHLEGRYDKFYDDLKKSQERMVELSISISRLDFTAINHEEIIDLLNKALVIMGELQEQWGKLVNFFGQIQALVQVTVKETLVPFVEQASAQLDTKKLAVEDRNLILNMLKDQTITIHRSTYMVFIMARTYVDMSERYLMNQIAGLSKMLTATNDTERNQLKSQLFNTSTTLTEEVGKMVLERKQQYHERINHRLIEVNDFLKNLGGVTAEDEKVVKDGTKLAGMADEDGDDVYLINGVKLPGLDK